MGTIEKQGGDQAFTGGQKLYTIIPWSLRCLGTVSELMEKKTCGAGAPGKHMADGEDGA